MCDFCILYRGYFDGVNFGTSDRIEILYEMLEDVDRDIEYEDLLLYDLIERILVFDPEKRLKIGRYFLCFNH